MRRRCNVMTEKMNRPLRIAFMGTPDFVLPTIAALHNSDHNLVAIYTQPPREKGRKRLLERTPAHQYAEDKNIQIHHPANFKNRDDVRDFQNLNLDVAIVAAYGLLLPQDILDAPKHGCINIHPSLLPRWRGPSPIQYAVWKGDLSTGVSVMSLEKKMDAGPILTQEKMDIDGKNFTDLNKDLWVKGTQSLMTILAALSKTGALKPTAQDHAAATYCKLLTKEDGKINWAQTAIEIDCQIRGLNPWPGTWCLGSDDKRVKVLEAVVLDETAQGDVGKILQDGRIICGENTILQLKIIQPENKKPMDVMAAINGGYLQQECVLK